MVYSIQNIETGEIDYVPQTRTVGCCCCSPSSVFNEETGELDSVPAAAPVNIGETMQRYDEETGEPQAVYAKPKKFHVPRRYFRGTMCEEFDNEIAGKYQDVIQPTAVPIRETGVSPLPNNNNTNDGRRPKKRRFFESVDFSNMDGVKNEIIMGYNKPNYRLFLIPTLLCFNVVLYLVVAVLEKILHMWAHKKNDLNMNKDVYFRSPLHIVTSQFCARCRAESEMDIKLFDRLNKQMREARRSRTLKDVSKVIG